MRNKILRTTTLLSLGLLTLVWSGTAWAHEEPAGPSTQELKIMVDTLWVALTAFLVFWMNAGFGCVEAGLCRSKNATNILAKNFIVFAISSLVFWAFGFGLMFGDGGAFVGANGWFLGGADNSPAVADAYDGVYDALNWTSVPLLCKFLFQLVFAGTAATIVSGCVAERIHYKSFMMFTVVLVGLVYPITGHWIWGGGWLQKAGMWDFAGSTVVHSVGGWAGLAGVLVLGPRIGKYGEDGKVQPIPGHSMALVFIGGLILWLGWFGFNPGSTMAANPVAIAHVAVTTNMACVAAVVSSTLLAWFMLGTPDFTMSVNGALAGLVAITAPCAFVSVGSSVIIGIIAGILVVLAVVGFDRLRMDDPVGALSVHLVNGIWGTLAIGIFATSTAPGAGPDGLLSGGGMTSLIAQLKGVISVGIYAFAISLAAWFIIRMVMGMRVTADEEIRGLDLSEMGMEAYGHDPGRM